VANRTSKKKKKEALQKLIRSVPEGEQVYEILASLAGNFEENEHAFDRMAAIVGATFVEYALKKAICHHLTPDPEDPEFDRLFYNDGAPLWEFSNRVKMAKSLGILEDGEYERLTHIRLIRNAFAHTMTPISSMAFIHPPLHVRWVPPHTHFTCQSRIWPGIFLTTSSRRSRYWTPR
jgi:hypothetical protein